MVTNHFNLQIEFLRSDKGEEFISKDLKKKLSRST